MDKSDQKPFPIERSSYYSLWLKEKEEISKIKWILSEKAGQDVGWDYSLWQWVFSGHRADWIAKMKEVGEWPPK